MTTAQVVLIALIICLIIGLIVFVLVSGMFSQKQKNLEIIRGDNDGAVSNSNIDEKDLQNKRRSEISKKLKSADGDEEIDDGKASIEVKLGQAGSSMSPEMFWGLSAVSCVVSLILAMVMNVSTLVMVLMAITGFMGVPKFILAKAIQRRQKKFLQEFADALDAVIRLLQAGMPVAEAVSMISREFEGPVGEEMSIIYDKQKIGIPLHEAALEATVRMPLPEVKMFAAGLAIQAQTGSSLSEVLANLSGVIRARFRLKRKVMALSSEAISSAAIIGSLPPLVGVALWFTNPGYLEPLFDTSTGNNMLMFGAFWMTCGVLVMKKMINFKI